MTHETRRAPKYEDVDRLRPLANTYKGVPGLRTSLVGQQDHYALLSLADRIERSCESTGPNTGATKCGLT